ncbi:MAG: 1-deoxy-D-xylulose-5-phosphate synthase, partial [Lachnospiraceae bacterium]|nr:1-deoxy-D-xylulose-5-phosphate synthase [Lachnospiraceae bacterium]
GLAAAGLKPVVAVYSSFLQRAYDQILHDVCIQNLPVVFAVDRAGLVGSDGETHQGIFDISYLSSIPNMTILAPKNKWELSDMVKFAVDFPSPIAIRYPRGEAYEGLREFRAPVEYGRSEMIYEESEIALIALGSMVKTGEEVRLKLKELGYPATLVNARFAKPLDEKLLLSLAKKHKLLVTLEENVINGGFGEHVTEFFSQSGKKKVSIINIAIKDDYVEHGNVDILRQEVGIDGESIVNRILEKYVSGKGKGKK